MNQSDLFKKNEHNNFVSGNINIKDGVLIYHPQYFNKEACESYFDYLYYNIDWKQEDMKIYGKTVLFPRLTAWYGDEGKNYTYSGKKYAPQHWTPQLLDIKQQLDNISNVSFNSVLLNWYRNGNDSMGWHQDNEKELGINPVIGSVSFGEKRLFQLRHKTTKEKINLELGNGSVLIMSGALQHFWQHQVPKVRGSVAERINLTFRVIL